MGNWKKNPAVAIGAVLVLVLVIVLMVLSLQPKKTKWVLMNKSGQVMEIALSTGTHFPVRNPQGGAEDLYPAQKVKCEKCGWKGYIIAYTEPGKPSETNCPKCGAEKRNLKPVK